MCAVSIWDILQDSSFERTGRRADQRVPAMHRMREWHDLPKHSLHPDGESRVQPVQHIMSGGALQVETLHYHSGSSVLPMHDGVSSRELQDAERDLLWQHDV